MTTTSDTTGEFLYDLGDRYAISVRIPDPLAFDAIAKETQEQTLCTPRKFINADTVEESSSTPGPETGPTGGVLLFTGPKNLYEKLRANVPNGFVAGRCKVLNDLVFSQAFGRISRHHFALGLYKNRWVVFNLSRNGTWVNDDYLIGKPSLALFIRCQYPNIARLLELWPNHDTTFSEIDISSQTTSIATSQHHSYANPNLPRIYYLEDQKLPSRTEVNKILALNAWSCDTYIAKAYPVAEKDRLQRRTVLLQALPQTSSGPFLQDHFLITADDVVYSLAPYLENIHTLQDVSEFTKESGQRIRDRHVTARQLLRNLLKAVSLLHDRYKISHGDLCLHTVFSDSISDCEQVFVSGFSKAASLTTARAKLDCLAILETVRGFLQGDPHPGWFAEDQLDSLWAQFTSLRNKKDWPHTVLELRDMLGLRLDGDDMLWRRLTVSRDVMIRYKHEGNSLRYHVDDIQTFAALAAMRSALAVPKTARENMKRSSSVLRRFIQERGDSDYISQDDFDTFSLHMAQNFFIDIALDHLSSRKASERSQKNSLPLFIVASVNFKIPYHTRYGWINLSSLRLLAPPTFPPSLLGMIQDCYEVRGHCCGVYVAIDKHLAMLAEPLGLRYSCDEVVNQGDKGFERYTWASGWFLLCPHESSSMVPVERANELVWGHQSLGKFLRSHMPHNPLDAKTAQDPNDLLASHAEMSLTYDGTIASSGDPLAFQFSVRGQTSRIWTEHTANSEKTAQWLNEANQSSCVGERTKQI